MKKIKRLLPILLSALILTAYATPENSLGYTNIVEFGGILDWKGEIEK